MNIYSRNSSILKTLRKMFFEKACVGIFFGMIFYGTSSPHASATFWQETKGSAVSVEGVEVPGFADIAQKVLPAVVSVRVKAKVKSSSPEGFQMFGGSEFEDIFPEDHPLKRFFHDFYDQGQKRKGKNNNTNPNRERIKPVAQGSGFFISEDGYLVTNNHVIKDGQEFTIILENGKEHVGRLIGVDPRTDLALLKVDSPSVKFTYVDFAEDSKIRIGDWVVAVGNSFGLGGTVTAGIVSARGRDIGAGPYDDFLQIDAAVNYGNSGGPAFNLKGKVVGVNTAIFSPSGGNVGIAFAIPSSTVKEVVTALMKDGKISRGWLGVQIQSVTEEISESLGLKEAKGALVADVSNDGPSKKAGILPGDIITFVDNKKILTSRDLARLIGNIKPGKEVELSLWRKGEIKKVKLSVGLLPVFEKTPISEEKDQVSQEILEELGLNVMSSENKEGLFVTDVDPEGIAAERGIKVGDRLYEINNFPIKNVKDLVDQIKEAMKAGRKSVFIQIKRGENTHFVPLLLPQLKK